MSTGKRAPKPAIRDVLLQKLWELGRTMSTQTVFLHQAIAQSVGLNATDTKCVDVILSGGPGGITAGRLAEVTGLSTGAVTHILDRLEKRKFIARTRDTDDRRKVFIHAQMDTIAPLIPKYEAVGRAYMEMVAQYSDKELTLICDYLEKTSAQSERTLKKVIAANRADAKSAK